MKATDMPKIELRQKEEHVAKLLRRVRDANELGRIGKRDYWIRSYLNSNDAKLLAVRRANRQFKSDRRVKKPELRAIAERLNPW